jgi:hypothetical protein
MEWARYLHALQAVSEEAYAVVTMPKSVNTNRLSSADDLQQNVERVADSAHCVHLQPTFQHN